MDQNMTVGSSSCLRPHCTRCGKYLDKQPDNAFGWCGVCETWAQMGWPQPQPVVWPQTLPVSVPIQDPWPYPSVPILQPWVTISPPYQCTTSTFAPGDTTMTQTSQAMGQFLAR